MCGSPIGDKTKTKQNEREAEDAEMKQEALCGELDALLAAFGGGPLEATIL